MNDFGSNVIRNFRSTLQEQVSRVRESDAYRQGDEMHVLSAAQDGMLLYLETKRQPTYESAIQNGVKTIVAKENVPWYRTISTTVRSLFSRPSSVEYSLVDQERRVAQTVRALATREPRSELSTLLDQTARTLRMDRHLTELHLKGFVQNYHEHQGETPLPFYKRELGTKLAEENILREVKRGSLTPVQGAARIRSQYGMTTRPEDLGLRTMPLDRIVEDAVGEYNTRVAAYTSRSDTGALYQLYQKGAARLGVDEETFKEALREHVRRSASGARGVQLGRFDRELVDYASFSAEAAKLYRSSPKTLTAVAQELSTKYGMRISSSSVSRIGREALARQGHSVKNRREARRDKRYAAR